jgi:hypothetical protein
MPTVNGKKYAYTAKGKAAAKKAKAKIMKSTNRKCLKKRTSYSG